MSTTLARLATKTLGPTGEWFGGHFRLEQVNALALPLGWHFAIIARQSSQ